MTRYIQIHAVPVRIFPKKAYITPEAWVISASCPPIWVQPGSPKPLSNRACARSQWARIAPISFGQSGVSRRSLCRRSSSAVTPIHLRFVKGLSMRVNLVVSNASNLPKSPWVVSPVRFSAISQRELCQLGAGCPKFLVVHPCDRSRRAPKVCASTGEHRQRARGWRSRLCSHDRCMYICYRDGK